MTRSDIRTRILEALNETANDPVFWSTAQVNAVIDEAQEVLAEELQAIKRTAFTALREGTTYYHTRGIAQDMMVPYRIWIPSLDRRLATTSLSQLDAFDERWSDTSGDPEFWFSMGWDWFGVYPHTTAGGGTMRVDYLAWPKELLQDSHEPEYLGADHDALVIYGVYDGLLKRWNLDEALGMFALFLDRLGKGKARSGVVRQSARMFQQSRLPGTSLARQLGNRFGNN